ncbi:MAG: HAD family hydrolase, partial [Candidatus Magasanikbacteria bacterium]
MHIKAIGFDWDGTLVDSMIVKSQAFASAVIEFHPDLKNKDNEIKQIYLATRGNPRFDQLSWIEEYYDKEHLDQQEQQDWSDTFTGNYIDLNLPLFENTISTLGYLKDQGYRLFLASSVPQGDLDDTLENYEQLQPLDNYFTHILGTREVGEDSNLPTDGKLFKKGVPHLTFISQELEVQTEEIAFVGDGPDDVKGANEAGAYSVGKADPRISFESL